jgi:glycosyltransferase involved in cell wall biosynthesis
VRQPTVAIVTRSSVWGGLETHTLDLANTLREDGFGVRVVCIGRVTSELYERAPQRAATDIVCLDADDSISMSNPIRWLRALRTVDADAAVFQKNTFNTGSAALDLALRTRFGAYVAIEHLEPPAIPPKASRRRMRGLVPGVGLWWYRWKAMGRIRSYGPALTVCVSNAVRRRLVADYGFSDQKLLTVHNGIDPMLFRPCASLKEAARRAWRVSDGSFVFGFAGRLVDLKAVDIILEAFATARLSSSRSMNHVIAGEGPERERLEQQARRLGVADHVRFLGFQAKPWEVYPGFDALLLPSRVEACPITAIEAMASGSEVIASSVGGIPEIVSDGVVGTLVPPDDPTRLSVAMFNAVSRPDAERSELLSRARDHVVRNFNRRTQYRRIASAVAGVAVRSGRGRVVPVVEPDPECLK